MAKAVAAENKVRTKKHQEYLRYKFSDPELKLIAMDLARENQEMENIEREKAQVVSTFKARTAESQAKVSKFSGWVREGYDYRMIDCETRYHVPEEGMKQTVRVDTGEVVREQKMDPHELQETLEFEEQHA